VGAAQSLSPRHCFCTQTFCGVHTSPTAHCVSSTQATQAPGLPPLPGLQCGAEGFEAQSFSTVQVVALGCWQTCCTGSQTAGVTQSALVRHTTQLPVELRQRGVGFAQSVSAPQAATHWCEALQMGAERLVQSVESRHCTQAWCCRSHTGAGGTQSRLEAQPGSAWHAPPVQSLPGPQSRETRHSTQAPFEGSHTGVAG
jgi:hypothetical protein